MNAVTLALAITLVPTLSAASDPRAQRGRTFALANCAQCHAVGPIGESPLRMRSLMIADALRRIDAFGSNAGSSARDTSSTLSRVLLSIVSSCGGR